jgi:hypothetical protein
VAAPPRRDDNRGFDAAQGVPMSMKKSDLDKSLGLKIGGRMKGAAIPARFAQEAGMPTDKREQRRRDAAAGLVPFACKLPGELVARLRERADAHPGGINALAAELFGKALG